MTALKLTVFTSHKPVVKKLNRDETWSTAPSMANGRATVHTVAGLEGLEELIDSLTPRQFMTLGLIADGRSAAPVATKRQLEVGKARRSAIARSKEHLALPSRGLFYIDVDDGSTPEQTIEHLAAFESGLAHARWLAVASSRHRVTAPDGRIVISKGGWHLYCVADGLDYLADWIRAYESWARSNGHARQVADAAGRYRWEYPIDTGVIHRAAVQPIYETIVLPRGYIAEKPRRWINPEGGSVTLSRPATPCNGKTRPQLRTPDRPEVADYNFCNPIEAALEAYGYRDHGNGAWSSPSQSGQSAGVQVYPDGRAFIFTDKDPLAGRNVSAFDLAVFYDYGGDRAAALRELQDEGEVSDAYLDARYQLQHAVTEAVRVSLYRYAKTNDEQWLGIASRLAGVDIGTTAEAFGKRHNLSSELVQEALDDEAKRQHGGMHKPGDWMKKQHAGSIEQAAQWLTASSASCYLQAPLGAGKTESALAPLARQHQRVLILNHLRALSGDLSNRLDAAHYQQQGYIDEAERLVSTVHSLTNWRVMHWIEDAPTLVIIDEAAAVADVLFQPGGNIKDSEQLRILHSLASLRDQGTRFVLADGDVTPAARTLADFLDVKQWIVAKGKYQQPAVEIHQATRQTFIDEKGKERTAPTAPLHQAIHQADRLALFCDTLSEAEAWGKNLSALTIHADNSGETQQSAFLDAPDQQAPSVQRLTYTSILGAGVSVTSTSASVFGIYSGHLAPHTTWQALRRYRRAEGNVIRIQVAPDATRPKRQQAVTDAGEWLEAMHDQGGAPPVGTVAAVWYAGRAAYCAMADRWQRCPALALATYLREAGINVRVVLDTDGEQDQAHQEARKQTKEERIDALATARRVDDNELARIRRATRKTRADAAAERRGIAERTLRLTSSDIDGDGKLPEKLAKAILTGNLERRAGMASWLWRTRPSACSDDELAQLLPGASRPHALLKWELAQATARFVGLDTYAPAEPGQRAITVGDVAELVELLRSILPSRGWLPLLRSMGLPELPRANAQQRAQARWLRDWLRGWGLESAGRVWIKGGDGRRTSASRWKLDTYAQQFGQRIAAAKNDVYEPANEIANERLYHAGCRAAHQKQKSNISSPFWCAAASG